MREVISELHYLKNDAAYRAETFVRFEKSLDKAITLLTEGNLSKKKTRQIENEMDVLNKTYTFKNEIIEKYLRKLLNKPKLPKRKKVEVPKKQKGLPSGKDKQKKDYFEEDFANVDVPISQV